MFKYRVYGLNVVSNLPLDCYPCEFEKEDIRFRFSQSENEVDTYLNQLADMEKPLECITKDGRGKLYLCGINCILVYYHSDYYLRCYLIHHLLGAAFALMMMRRKLLLLHGSCVVFDNNAAVLVGDSGAGKSTLAAGFVQYGGTILSDDMTRIELNSDTPFAYPGYPSRKLWKTTIDMMGIDTSKASEIIDSNGKFSISENNHDVFCNRLVPVISVVYIQPAETPDVRLVTEDVKSALSVINNNMYSKKSLKHFDLNDERLNFILTICDKIPIYTLYRPKDSFTVNEQAKTVLREIYKKDI